MWLISAVGHGCLVAVTEYLSCMGHRDMLADNFVLLFDGVIHKFKLQQDQYRLTGPSILQRQ